MPEDIAHKKDYHKLMVNATLDSSAYRELFPPLLLMVALVMYVPLGNTVCKARNKLKPVQLGPSMPLLKRKLLPTAHHVLLAHIAVEVI